MSTAPTYKEFRTFALARGWTPKDLALFVQADNPLKSAARILYHLAGTRWDAEPLPYPKLCQLYRGSAATTPAAPAPRGHVELAEALVSGRKDRPWLKPDQYTVTHRFTDPYLYVTLEADAPAKGSRRWPISPGRCPWRRTRTAPVSYGSPMRCSVDWPVVSAVLLAISPARLRRPLTTLKSPRSLKPLGSAPVAPSSRAGWISATAHRAVA